MVSFDEGAQSYWKSGALIGGGDYMSIEQNRRTVYVETPYDDTINALSIRLNDTYFYYGEIGKQKKAEQKKADSMALNYSKSNLATRNTIKSSQLYLNTSWDLVDASKSEDFEVAEVDKNTLPKELQNKTNQELKLFIETQNLKREQIKNDINTFKLKRETYLRENLAHSEVNVESSMIDAIKKQAKAKNYSW